MIIKFLNKNKISKVSKKWTVGVKKMDSRTLFFKKGIQLVSVVMYYWCLIKLFAKHLFFVRISGYKSKKKCRHPGLDAGISVLNVSMNYLSALIGFSRKFL